jgi:hypothetical protein
MSTLLKLTNASFEIEFNGKLYSVRKASLEQVIKFMQKAEDYKKDGLPITQSWIKLVSYALLLALSPQEPTLTEEFIASNIPGNCNAVDVLITLGFINPPPQTAPVVETRIPTTEPSSPSSPTGQDGLQKK